jgi:hypothetical protein
MATQISNVVPPAQAALNGKLYGGGANAFGQQAPTAPAPQSSFDSGASQLFNNIGGAIKGGINAVANTKFGQQQAPPAGPFGAVSPALQSSANTAQASAANTQPASMINEGAGTGIASSMINQGIGTGATLNGLSVSGAPGSAINGGGITQANDQPNLPVTPQNSSAQVFNPQTGTWGPSTPQAPFNAATTGLLGAPAQNNQLGQNATDITNSYNKQIAALAPLTSAAGDLTTGTQAVGGGNASIDSNAVSSRIQALEGQESQQLAGNTQGITAQGQAQSALNSAGNLAQPQLGSIGQVPFSPTNYSQGSPLGAPGGTAADAAKVLGGFQGAQAAAAAPGQAQASNTQTAGTASTNSYAGIYNTANTNAANYSQQQSAINAVGSQALNLLNSIPDRSSSQFANAKLNQLATQFSSPEYAAFNTAIQSLQARIGQALQAGEIPTAATGNAQAIANGNLTVGALASTLQQVDKEMGAFVQTQNDLANYAKTQIGSSGSTNTSAGAGGTAAFSDSSFYGQ